MPRGRRTLPSRLSAETIYEELAKRGCQMLSGPCISPDGKARVFFAKDPEGNYLELVEEL